MTFCEAARRTREPAVGDEAPPARRGMISQVTSKAPSAQQLRDLARLRRGKLIRIQELG